MDSVVTSADVEQGVVVLSVRYDRELLTRRDAGRRLADDLVERYRDASTAGSTSAHCVVLLDAPVVGSPLARALFELWKVVAEQRGGQLVCVGYPPAYIDTLSTLGILDLPRFSQAPSRADALKKVLGQS
jgi:hypothetical protein